MTSDIENSSEMNLYSESDLTCCICTELYYEPTTLKCNHSFCLYCIERWKHTGHMWARRTCPLCRQAIRIQFRNHSMDAAIRQLLTGCDEECLADRERVQVERAEILQRRRLDPPSRERRRYDPHQGLRFFDPILGELRRLDGAIVVYLEEMVSEMQGTLESLLNELQRLRTPWYTAYLDNVMQYASIIFRGRRTNYLP